MVINSAESLLAPMSSDEFIEKFLEKEVLLLERDDAGLVEGIFDLDSMSHCLRFMKPQMQELLRVIPRGDEGEITAQAIQSARMSNDDGLGYLAGEFGRGSTLTFNSAESYWLPITRIVDDLMRVLASNVKCNVYCTPPESQGFDTHVDGHDVLVLQTSGSKTWRIHDVQNELPVESSPMATEMFPRLGGPPDYGDPVREVVLRPGDLLYLPRGVPHSAASTAEHSVHLTIGLYPIRTHQLIGKLVDLLAFADVRLRRRIDIRQLRGDLPVESAGDILRGIAEICDQLDEPLDMSRLMAAELEQTLPRPGTAGLFRNAIEAEKMDLDTIVEWPEGASWSTRRTEHDFRVRCGGSMAIPHKLEPVLGFFESTSSFRVGDAPEILKDSAKVTLCRNLVQNGLLRITGRSASKSSVPTAGPKPEIPDWLASAGF